MSASSSSSSSGGIGFVGALALLFIALKLLGFIDWSWWWVLAPIWGSFALVLVIVVLWVGGLGWADFRKYRRRAR